MYHVTMRVRTGTDPETGLPEHEEITEEIHGQDATDAMKAGKAAAARWQVRVDKIIPGPDPDPRVHADQERIDGSEDWTP